MRFRINGKLISKVPKKSKKHTFYYLEGKSDIKWNEVCLKYEEYPNLNEIENICHNFSYLEELNLIKVSPKGREEFTSYSMEKYYDSRYKIFLYLPKEIFDDKEPYYRMDQVTVELLLSEINELRNQFEYSKELDSNRCCCCGRGGLL